MSVVFNALDWVFGVYFVTHIPITLFFDLQILLPAKLFPNLLQEGVTWYSQELKDPMVLDPPIWYKAFVVCELFVQFPFFIPGAYAFLKGGCPQFRIPLLLYATHVSTTVFAILAHIFLHDFSDNTKYSGPSTLEERVKLAAVYSIYFMIPLLMVMRLWLDKDFGIKKKTD